MFKIIIPALALSAMVAPAFASDNWTTDLPAALDQAAKEQKLVLVDFNGSDWCAPCITLKSKVFDTEEFQAYAKDKFILVDIDLPRNKEISPELLETNQALIAQYGVQGFPSVYVMNPQGIVVGGFVGGNDSVSVVKAFLDVTIVDADKLKGLIEHAATLTGSELAKALHAVYNMVPVKFQAANTKLMSKIKALYKEGSDDLQKRASNVAHDVATSRIMGDISAVAKDPHALLKSIDKELANEDISEELRMRLSAAKLQSMLLCAESVEDLKAAKAWGVDFAKTLPKPDALLSHIEKMFSDPAKLLEERKAAIERQDRLNKTK